MTKQAYDDFSRDYDRFVNWEERLSVEMPFLLEQLNSTAPVKDLPVRVLDAACGTGMHAISLAKQGMRVSGADISTEMIRIAKKNTHTAQVDVEFKPSGFNGLAQAFSNSLHFPFDALICLGNSLPHLLTPQAIQDALSDMAECLRPGGLLLLQNRNFNAVMAEKNRWLGTQFYREANQKWLFLRFYDFDPDGLITFNIIRMHKDKNDSWSQQVSSTRIFPLEQESLLQLLGIAGFHQISCFGHMGNEVFDPIKSGNLVITALKS